MHGISCNIMRFSLVVLLALIAILPANCRTIELEGQTFHSSLLDRDVRYSVLLPEGYDKSENRYPVIYLFHGIGGDYSSWLEYGNLAATVDRLIGNGKIKPCIIVMPDGYLSYYNDTFDGSFPYERFFINEFVPFIDNKYPTLANQANRAVGGFSMGGFGSLSIALRNRNIFNTVAALSASIRTDEQYMSEMPQGGWDDQWGRIFGGTGDTGAKRITRYYKERSPYHILKNSGVTDGFNIMLDIGDKEGTLCRSNEELHRMLVKKGIEHKWTVRDGAHDFKCWNAALPEMLMFMSDGFKSEGTKPLNSNEYVTNVSETPGATIYSPSQAKGSDRKYPVIYFTGVPEDLRKTMADKVYRYIAESHSWPLIICFIHDGAEDLNKTINEIENNFSMIRTCQRMRGMVSIGKSSGKTINSLNRDNMFTGIIFAYAENMDGAAIPKEKLLSYKRYPRFFIETLSTSEDYPFSSDLHIFLNNNKMEHSFRSYDAGSPDIISRIPDWIDFLNNRIHY